MLEIFLYIVSTIVFSDRSKLFRFKDNNNAFKQAPENPFQTMILQISLFKPKTDSKNLSKIPKKSFKKICPQKSVKKICLKIFQSISQKIPRKVALKKSFCLDHEKQISEI